MIEIKSLKRGEFFRFPNRSVVYVFDGYCRSLKKYEYHRFDDMNTDFYTNGNKLVDTEFEF